MHDRGKRGAISFEGFRGLVQLMLVSLPNQDGFFTCRAANVLTGAGNVKRGDRVIVILPRLPEWWVVNIACLRSGNVYVTYGTPGNDQRRITGQTTDDE